MREFRPIYKRGLSYSERLRLSPCSRRLIQSGFINMSLFDCLNCNQEDKICREMLLTLAEFIKEYRFKNQVQQKFDFEDGEEED